MQVCQLSQAGLQCSHCKTGSSPLNSKDLSGGSQHLQAAHPKQQNLYSDDPNCDSKLSPCMQRAHTGPQKHQHHHPEQFHQQDTDRKQQGGQNRVFNSLIKLNKALNIYVLVSKTQEQQTKSVMGLNGSRTAGRAGNSIQHREDLFPFLMVIYALARAASALNIYHPCYLHLWLHLCHPMTRYCLVLPANSDMPAIACYTNLTTCCW